MSDESTGRIPSNEEVIDDLTKNFRDAQFDVPQDFEALETESDKPPGPPALSEDSDEEELKNQDLDLTDEEKEQRKLQASVLKTQGNEEFKSGRFLDSINTYSQALRICPLKFGKDRAILYSNRAASKTKIERKTSAIEDCSKAITLNDSYVKAYLRRAKLYAETDKLDESLEDYKKILELDPENKEAMGATSRLPPLIQERNEKLKTEMLDKLKDLGNMFLRPFGLSTNNFKMQQDPNTGGYSVNFQQNSTN